MDANIWKIADHIWLINDFLQILDNRFHWSISFLGLLDDHEFIWLKTLMFQQIYSTFVHVAISIFLMWTINYVSCHQFFCYGLLLVWSISDCWNSWQFLHNNDKIYLPLGSQEVLQIPPKYTLFKDVIKFVMSQNKQKVCRCSCHCNFSNSVTRISKLKKKTPMTISLLQESTNSFWPHSYCSVAHGFNHTETGTIPRCTCD